MITAESIWLGRSSSAPRRFSWSWRHWPSHGWSRYRGRIQSDGFRSLRAIPGKVRSGCPSEVAQKQRLRAVRRCCETLNRSSSLRGVAG
ncbi:MAG: hypothetical protein E5W38_25185 [Mesorhizobium sp.]|nr:MAG: hypothetical protein E5W38_25185 [Mesorhizobium sp.]